MENRTRKMIKTPTPDSSPLKTPRPKTAPRILSSDEEEEKTTSNEHHEEDPKPEERGKRDAEEEAQSPINLTLSSTSEDEPMDYSKFDEEAFDSFHESQENIKTPEDFSETSVARLDYLIDQASSLLNYVVSRDPNRFVDCKLAFRTFAMILEIIDIMTKMYEFFEHPVPKAILDPTSIINARDLCKTTGQSPYRYQHILEMLEVIIAEAPIERKKIMDILDQKIAALEADEKNLMVNPQTGHFEVAEEGLMSPESGVPVFDEYQNTSLTSDDAYEIEYVSVDDVLDELTFESAVIDEVESKRKKRSRADFAGLVDPVTGVTRSHILGESLKRLRQTTPRRDKLSALDPGLNS